MSEIASLDEAALERLREALSLLADIPRGLAGSRLDRATTPVLELLPAILAGTQEALKKARQDGVGAGMAIAAAVITDVWGDETQAREILGAAGLTSVAALRKVGVDDYDVRKLRPVLRAIRSRDPHASKALSGGAHD